MNAAHKSLQMQRFLRATLQAGKNSRPRKISQRNFFITEAITK
jgi:hypothetical protein